MSNPASPIPAIETLKRYPTWLTWNFAERLGNKPTKKPFGTDGGPGSTTNPETWGNHAAAVRAKDRDGRDGIGFVFAPIVGIDIDGCRNPLTGAITAKAEAIIRRLNTYTEVSPTGTGLHCIGYGHVPDVKGGRRNDDEGVEIYDSGRFFTVTGDHLPSAPDTLNHCQAALNEIYAELFPPKLPPLPPPTPSDRPTASIDIATRIERMLAKDAKAARLWHGDMSDYIDPTHPNGNHSEADAGLCSKLVWWFDGDRAAVESEFRRSALYRSDKWEREDYRRSTIDLAFVGFTGGYTGTVPAPTLIRPAVDVPPPVAEAESPCAALQARIAELEAQLAEQTRFAGYWQDRAERAERAQHELEDRLTWLSAVQRNKKIHTEAASAIALVNDIAASTSQGKADADGFVRAPNTRIARNAAVSAQTMGKHKQRLVEWGLLELSKPRWIPEEPNPVTGGTIPAHTEQFVRLTASVPATLAKLATLDPAKPQHGGLRLKACPAHPDAPLRTEWQKTCTICDAVVDAGSSVGKSAARKREVPTQDAYPLPSTSSTVDTRTSVSQDAQPLDAADEVDVQDDVPPCDLPELDGFARVKVQIGRCAEPDCRGQGEYVRRRDGCVYCVGHAAEWALSLQPTGTDGGD